MTNEIQPKAPVKWIVWRLAEDSGEYGENAGKVIITTEDGQEEICGVVHKEANAHLIATAPEMLELLCLCEDVLSEFARTDDGTPSISALHMARDLIARANGDGT